MGKKERKDREGWQIKGMARKEKENKKGDKKKTQRRELKVGQWTGKKEQLTIETMEANERQIR